MKKLLLALAVFFCFPAVAQAGELAAPGIVIPPNDSTGLQLSWVTKGDEWVRRTTGFNGWDTYVVEHYYSPTGIQASRLKIGDAAWKGSGIFKQQPWQMIDHWTPDVIADWCRLVKRGAYVWKVKPGDGDGMSDCSRDKTVSAGILDKSITSYSCSVRTTTQISCRSGSNKVKAVRTTQGEITDEDIHRAQEVKYCGAISAGIGGFRVLTQKSTPSLCESFTDEAGIYLASHQWVYSQILLQYGNWSCIDLGTFLRCSSGMVPGSCVAMLKPHSSNTIKFVASDYDERGVFFYAQVSACQ